MEVSCKGGVCLNMTKLLGFHMHYTYALKAGAASSQSSILIYILNCFDSEKNYHLV